MTPVLSFIIPTRRPARLVDTLTSFHNTTVTYDVEALVVADLPETHSALERIAHIYSPVPVTAPQAWNLGAATSKAQWFGLGADDLLFHPGWIEAVWPLMQERWGVIGINDGADSFNRLGWATHWLVSREFCMTHMGGVMVPPVYAHGMVDVEVCQLAQRLGMFTYAAGAKVEHLHPDWNKADRDALYERDLRDDKRMFNIRALMGFPVAWEPALSAPQQPRTTKIKKLPIDKSP